MVNWKLSNVASNEKIELKASRNLSWEKKVDVIAALEEKWLHWLHEYFTGRINYIHARLRLHWGKNYNKISFQLKLLIKPSRKRKETQNDLFVQHCRCAGVVNVNKSRRMNNLFARKLRQTLAIMSYPLRRWKMMKMMNMHDVRQEHKSWKKMSGIWLDVFPFHVDTSWLILFRGWNIAIAGVRRVRFLHRLLKREMLKKFFYQF